MKKQVLLAVAVVATAGIAIAAAQDPERGPRPRRPRGPRDAATIKQELGLSDQQLSDLHAANLRARLDAQLALRKILTPDQQAKLTQLRAQRLRPRRPGPRRGGGDDAEREALTRPDVR